MIAALTRDVQLTAPLTAARTYTLPAASGYPAGTRITFADFAQTLTSTNTATLARAGTDTVNGGASIVLSTAGASPMLISDGATKWNLDIRGVARGGTGLTSGTSGGVLAFTATGTLSSSAALATNALVIGGGAGAAPSTTTTGTGVLTFLGTPTSANLAAALTNETGSGALVFGTSPTFTTPLLGTPASGTLTNCTGYTISNLTSGTSASLAGVLSDETGSGAAVFASAPSLTSAVLTTPSLGTPSSGSLGNCTGYTAANLASAATGITSFLGAGTSATLASALNDELGSGKVIFSAGTLAVASTKTLTASNTLTFTGTDSSSVAFGAGGTVLYSGGALGTPASGVGTNLTALTPANLTGSTTWGRALLTAKTVVRASWFGYGSGNISGTTATKYIAGDGNAEIYYSGAITGVTRLNSHNNFSTSYPYQALFPGTRGAVVPLPTNATVDWSQSFVLHWTGTAYLGSNGAEQNYQIGCSYGLGTAALNGKGFRVKLAAVGTGATDTTISIIGHNGTSESTGGTTGTMSGGDYTLHNWVFVWTAGTGAYIYLDGTLKASMTASLPSGTGTANCVAFQMTCGAAGADAVQTVQDLQVAWQ